ncbi:MAG: hypothetical protein V3T31_11640 [candidate division Zixibacteria bacterium]
MSTRQHCFVPAIITFAIFVTLGLMPGCFAPDDDKPLTDSIDSPPLLTFSSVEEAWQHADGSGTKVAVLDWLFDMSEEAKVKYIDAKSMIPDMPIGTVEPWHGEWMAEIVHRIAPGAKIIPIRCNPGREEDDPNDRFESYEKYLWAGIRYAADHGAVAVTNSMGPVRHCNELAEAIDYAEDRGTIFVDVHPEYIAYDGEQYQFCDSGACDSRIIHTGVIAVPDYKVEPDANRDIYLWPYAPEPVYKDGWGFSNGPPQVAGAIALMKSVNPDLNNDEVREIILGSSFVLHGFNVLDTESCVLEALKRKTVNK